MGETFSHKEKSICGWEKYFSESLGDRKMMKQPLQSPRSLLRKVGVTILLEFEERLELFTHDKDAVSSSHLPTQGPESCSKKEKC